jgi:beta-glucosidase
LETDGYLYPEANETYTQVNWHVNVQDDHAALIREIGGASTVLLKNTNNALPLNKPKSVAVIGEDAHDNPGGPNACSDRGCDIGTLAMGWGSGTANFPYLISPNTALKAQAANDKSAYANVSNNYDLEAVAAAVTGAEVAIVFGNANSGEDYITVDNNQGDRNNLTLWGNADALIAYVASLNPNTIVVLHTVGPVIVEALKQNPNITAILWAGLPGQESGNALTDVLYGKVNPQAKTVFTWGKSREDYGVDVEYTFPSDPPQLNFNEGLFIDYRHFDAAGIEPSYEFGFGLSYTNFSYSNLQISKQNPGPYQPTTGLTSAAPTFGTIDYNPADAEFPPGFHAVPQYVYPYISGPIPTDLPQNWPEGSQDGSPQPKLPAGGSGGGNRQLYDIMYIVSATVTNTGPVKGTEIAQLVRLIPSPSNHVLIFSLKQYLSLGGPSDPKVVLRGFDDLILDAGESGTFTYQITRRDISNWDPISQDWVVSSYPKTVYVGASSRNLPLNGALT